MNNKNILKISSVKKHHDLVQAYYGTSSLNEQKLFNFLIYSIKNKKITDNILTTTHKEIIDFLGFKINYKLLKNTFEKIMSVVLELSIISKDKKAYRLTHFVREVIYENRVIDIELSSDFISMILNDKDNYCTLNFALINKFKSKYTIRLYENITRYMTRENPFIHLPKMDIKTFRKLMGIEEGKYQRITHFKASVLDVAVNEINTKTDIKISYELFKSANEITDILFHSKFKNLSSNVVENALFFSNEKLLDFIDIFLPKYANKKVVGFINNKEVYFHKINENGGKRLVINDIVGETVLNSHTAMEVLTKCYENKKTFEWFNELEYENFLQKISEKKYTENFKSED